MKTANPLMQMFRTQSQAQKHFDSVKSADLLYHDDKMFGYNYFVDQRKTAIKHWPKLYTLIKTK